MAGVLLISPVAERGGSDQAMLRLARDLGRAEVPVHVVVPAPSPLGEELAAAGATEHVVPMRRITTGGGRSWFLRYALEWPLAVARLVRLVRRVDADVVASNSLHSWYGWAVAKLTGRPHVWHAREIVVQSVAALRLERELVRRSAALLVACSRAVAEQFRDVLPSERLVVVHEDVDRDDYRPARAGAFRAEAGIAEDVPLVGFVGRIDTWKGIDVLLDAWPAVRDACPTAELIVVGGPVLGKEDFDRAQRTRASRIEGVRWVGPVLDTRAVMADLDVFVAPSTSPEPYGLVLVEALASGARVVSTAAGGPPEIAARADDGAVELVPRDDPPALTQALLDQLRRGGSTSTAARRRRPVPLAPFPTDWSALYAPFLGRSSSAVR